MPPKPKALIAARLIGALLLGHAVAVLTILSAEIVLFSDAKGSETFMVAGITP